MKSLLNDVQTSISMILNSILSKPREEPGQGHQQDRVDNYSTGTRQKVVGKQTFRTDSGRTGATTMEVAAGIVTSKGT